MIKLIVFDWNGVLFADTLACMDADNHVLNAFGGKPITLKQFRETIIIPAIDFYVEHGCNRKELSKNVKKEGEIFHEFYEKRASKCRSRKGAKEILKWLKKNNIKSVILSNHTTEGIELQLKRLKLKNYISEVLANSERETAMKSRNKLLKLKDYIKLKKYKKHEVAIVGDSPEEIEIGRICGIKTIAITDGYYSTSRLKAARPDFLINNLTELIGVVKNIQI